MKKIHVSLVDGKPAVCFDTGLDSRSFARTKMSQSLVEPGYIVQPDGSYSVWKSTGVNEINGSMRVWGPPFAGKRLDLLINIENQQTALQAAVFWIRAKMLLGDTRSSTNPGAALISCEEKKGFPKGAVFFMPKNLSNRCLLIEETQTSVVLQKNEAASEFIPVTDLYNCPDLFGMEAAAFCAGVMLYKILIKEFPHKYTNALYQDMREGIFLPPHLAAPGLDENLSNLIYSALLLPVTKKRTSKSAADILGEMLNILMGKENLIIPVSTLFNQQTNEENLQIEKNRNRYLLKQNTSVRIKRFAIRNKFVFLGSAISLFFILVIIFSTTKSIGRRPTTEGMPSDIVVVAYYEAFSMLDHLFMEACLQGADKTDLNIAINFTAFLKTRQAYENTVGRPLIISARVWRDNGGELPAPDVFGVTDLVVITLAGDENADMIIYQADYLLWSPDENYSRNRSDILTLRRDRKKNWRITEILRTER